MTIQPDSIFDLTFLQGAALSVDGRRVAYVVARYEKTETAAEAHQWEEKLAIWLLDVESRQVRQLTSGTTRDSAPAWSPQGDQLAFLSTRSGKAQIYLLPVNGGEAQQVTTMPQGVAGGPVWSPDGTHIAFGAPPQSEPRKSEQPYRVTRHIYRFDVLNYVHEVKQDLYVLEVASGAVTQLTQDEWHNSLPVWSPNGQEIAYTAMFQPDSHKISSSVRIVSLAGHVRDLVTGGDASFMAIAPTWTPDGQQLVFVGNPDDAQAGTQNNLWIVGREGGRPQNRTPDFGYHVGGALQPDMPAFSLRQPQIQMHPSGSHGYVQVQVRGTVQIFRMALSGPEACTPVTQGDQANFPLGMVGEKLLTMVTNLADPGNLALHDLTNGQVTQLTDLNRSVLSQWGDPVIEHLTFPGPDQVAVEGWFMHPSQGEAPHPTILYIHGGPHSAFGHLFHFDFRMLAAAGYGVLIINQRASTGYGDAFAQQITGDWGNLDYGDLMAGVDHAIASGWVDENRMGVCGLSGGGNLSCWIVGQTDRFKAAVPENPVTNWVSFYGVSDIGPWFAEQELGGKPHEIPEIYRRCSPITYAHRCTTPTLLIQGEADWRCPAEQSEQFYTVLKVNGCPVEMVRLPQSPHAGSIQGPPALRLAQNEALLGWMNRYVLGAEQR